MKSGSYTRKAVAAELSSSFKDENRSHLSRASCFHASSFTGIGEPHVTPHVAPSNDSAVVIWTINEELVIQVTAAVLTEQSTKRCDVAINLGEPGGGVNLTQMAKRFIYLSDCLHRGGEECVYTDWLMVIGYCLFNWMDHLIWVISSSPSGFEREEENIRVRLTQRNSLRAFAP